MLFRSVLAFVILATLNSQVQAATVVPGNDDSSKQLCVQKLVQNELERNKALGLEITRVAASGIPLPAGPRRFSYVAKTAQNLNFFGTILVDVDTNETKTQCNVSSGSILGVSLHTDVFTLNQQLVRY